MSRKSPLYRRGMLGAVLFFGVISFAGVGWALMAGKPSEPNPYISGRMALKEYAATVPLSREEHSTLRRAKDGAIVGYGTALSGDTLELGGRKFRLWGVRAYRGPLRCKPGSDPQTCAQSPLSLLQRWVNGAIIACYPRATGLYGDQAAQCYRGNQDLGTVMIAAGMASGVTAETRMYALTEQTARSTQAGYWYR